MVMIRLAMDVFPGPGNGLAIMLASLSSLFLDLDDLDFG